MTSGPREPTWISRPVDEAIHDFQVLEHGGAKGLRDAGALESALANPRNQWSYGNVRDLASLAASYASSLLRSHPFVDGNKRTAFLVAYVFLARNRRELDADEAEVASIMWKLARGDLSEDDLAEWIRSRARSTD